MSLSPASIRYALSCIARADMEGDWREVHLLRLLLLESMPALSPRHEAERRELIICVHETARLDRRYDMQRAIAMDDPTGQELDAFLAY